MKKEGGLFVCLFLYFFILGYIFSLFPPKYYYLFYYKIENCFYFVSYMLSSSFMFVVYILALFFDLSLSIYLRNITHNNNNIIYLFFFVFFCLFLFSPPALQKKNLELNTKIQFCATRNPPPSFCWGGSAGGAVRVSGGGKVRGISLSIIYTVGGTEGVVGDGLTEAPPIYFNS